VVSLSSDQFDIPNAAIHLLSMPLHVFDYQVTYNGDKIFGYYMAPWRKGIHKCSTLE